MGFTGAVPASTALSSSLNLPAVQLLEAYGPKRFAAQMRIGGVPLALPALAEPNLALMPGRRGQSPGRSGERLQRFRPRRQERHDSITAGRYA